MIILLKASTFITTKITSLFLLKNITCKGAIAVAMDAGIARIIMKM